MTHNSPIKPIATAQGRAVTATTPVAARVVAKLRPGRPRGSIVAKTGPNLDDILDRYGGD
jgi:hypothetical protein